MEAAATDVRPLTPATQPGAATRTRVALVERATGGLALIGIVVGTCMLVIAAAQGGSSLSNAIKGWAPGWLMFPFHGIWANRTLDHHYVQVGFTTVMVAMVVFYGVALWLARRLPSRWIWTAVVAVQLICLFAPPMLLTDVFNYIGYARMGVLHHLNPYTHLPLDTFRDPVYRFSNWHHLPSPYGPLFTLGTYALVPLGIAGAYWGYKIALIATAIFCLWLTARICRRLGVHPMPALVLVGLNPQVIIYGTASQHNDWFQLLFVLGSIELFLIGRTRLSAAGIVAAAVFKSSAAALVPAGVLGQPDRRRALVGAAIGAVVLGALWIGAFGPHAPAIGIQSKLVTPFSMPNIAGLFLGRGGEDDVVRTLFEGLFVVATIACAYLAWRRREPILALGWLTAVSLITIGWDMAWYVLWLLPFVAFIRDRRFRIVAIGIVVWMTVQWTPSVNNLAGSLGFNPTHKQTWLINSRYTSRYVH